MSDHERIHQRQSPQCEITLPDEVRRALTDEQLAIAKDIFDEFRELDLQPAYLADADPNRALLDRRVV
ncbi:MAG: hypothetical protein F4Y44_03700 [Chloroflexi bacterium]|nr:hypothetical protein [Chloroflexota bacterium]